MSHVRDECGQILCVPILQRIPPYHSLFWDTDGFFISRGMMLLSTAAIWFVGSVAAVRLVQESRS